MDYLKSKAIVLERPRQASIREIELAPPRKDSVVARTTLSGISSGTDMKTWCGNQHPSKLYFPLVPGYESVGIIEQEGSYAPEFKVGDRVMINQVRKFGNVCAAWGGNVQYAVKNSESCRPNDTMARIPDNVSDLDAVLAYLACVSHKGILKAPIRDGDIILVSGAGMIGISAMQIAKILYPRSRVFCLERNPFRCEIARPFAEHVLRADDDAAALFNELTGGHRADVIIECSGNSEVVGKLNAFLKSGGWLAGDGGGGHIHLQGDYPDPIILTTYEQWFTLNCTISMSCALYATSKPIVLDWMSRGLFQTRGLPVEIWPAGKCNEAFEYYEKKRGDVFKIAFDWRDV